MRTNRHHYLQQKPPQKLNFISFLLTFVAVIFLSACGIKGDLYQTPEQALIPKDKVVEQRDDSQEKSTSKSVESSGQVVTTLDESQKQQAVKLSTEQTTTPSVKQPTEQVKEQQ